MNNPLLFQSADKARTKKQHRRYDVNSGDKMVMADDLFRNRAGQYVRQPQGYRAFIPAELPPKPEIVQDSGMSRLLSLADQSLGRLDGVSQMLPDPDLFVAMYVRQEAVYSSQIEGTQSSLDDVLEFELDHRGRSLPIDVEEVVNYVRAMNYGLRRLDEFPLSLRLIREIHAELLQDTRGSEHHPGKFRSTQNWIGPANTPLRDASFVPPTPSILPDVLGNFERFLHDQETLPDLLHCGIAHAQFETINPFLDGNGRIGRLLITLLLCHRGVLQRPLLYISLYLMRHRQEYYDRLMEIRENGDWAGWLRFFLNGVVETSQQATRTAQEIVRLQQSERSMLQDHGLGANSLRLMDLLFERPIVDSSIVIKTLGVAPATGHNLIARFEGLGLLREITGAQRNRRYRFDRYLNLFDPNATGSDDSVASIEDKEHR